MAAVKATTAAAGASPLGLDPGGFAMSSRHPSAYRRVLRGGLALPVAPALPVVAWALFAPRSFYTDFPWPGAG